MSSSTDHRSPITDHRSFLSSRPALIMAVSLLLGCFVGRFIHEDGPSWLPVTAPAISILAILQPSPLALGAVGIIAGIAFEGRRISLLEEGHEFEGRDLTLKGKIIQEWPSLYGQRLLRIRATEVWGLERIPVKFHFMVNLPRADDSFLWGELLIRAALRENGSRVVPSVFRGHTVASGWLPVPEPVLKLLKGRARLLKVLDNKMDSPASGLLGAISLGERWRVNARTRDILQKTGTYHLLAISGVHVGAAILPFLLLGRLCALASKRTRPHVSHALILLLSIVAISIYLRFTGLSASALRATIYFILVGAMVLVGRSSSPLVSLSWCIVIIVCFSTAQQPDISLGLSALAVTGIILSGRGQDGGGHSCGLKTLLRMTMGAVLFTLPCVVWLAGGISTISPLGNIVAGIPFGLFLIPLAVLTDWAALLPWVPLEALIGIWLKTADLVLGFMAYMADLPFSFQRLSTMGCLVASMATVIGILIWQWKRYRLRVGIAIFCFILITSGSGQLISERISGDDLVINFPAVGQADLAIIRYKGRTVLVDCGPEGLPGRDSPVARALQGQGVRKIDAVFLSHLHPDHAGGLEDIMVRWPVEVLNLMDWRNGENGLENLLDTGRTTAKVRFLHYGDEVNIGSLKFKVFGPDESQNTQKDINRGSLQLLLEVDGFLALFTGDAGWDQVLRSLGKINSLHMIKIPHHGSKKGFPPAGLDGAVTSIRRHDDVIAVCPSLPPGNRHLPASEVVRWFEGKGVRFVYTGENGVKIRFKKGGSTGNGSTVVDNHDWF